MIYHLVRPVARYVLRYYYRNIDLTGLEHIPPDAAVVLAANHPTAFIEPCVLACFQPRTLWFLARGNLFRNRFFSALLDAVHILPVFRLEDGGYGKLKDNYATFAACHRALSRRRAIMILAEGRCIHERALRPLRKGTARLALGALDGDPTLPEVYVVPVGCNFTDATRPRSGVLIRCGAPLLASTYLADYRRNEAATIRRFTADLRERLSPLVVQFPDGATAAARETRLAADRADHPAPAGVTHDGRQLTRELALAAAPLPDPDRWSALGNEAFESGLPLAARPARAQAPPPARATWLRAGLALLLQLPQLPLWALAAYFRDKPKHIEFAGPVHFATVAGGTFLLYPLALVLLPWWAKLWLAAALLTVRPCLRWWEALRHARAARRWSQRMRGHPDAVLRRSFSRG